MEHHTSSAEWKEDEKTAKLKSRIGLWMFFIYSVIYSVFIIINVVNPKLMGLDIGSLNLAIVFGFGLIILALIMALLYNALCGWVEEKTLKLEKLQKKLNKENR